MIDASWYQKIPGVPESTSAGGVVVRREDEQIYVALIVESSRPGYVLPKGRLEVGETIIEAACREIEEEAGLSDLTLVTKLGVEERLSLEKVAWKMVHYFLFTTNQVEGKPTDTEKDYELHWFPLDNLPAIFWPNQRQLIENNRELIKKHFKSE